MSTSHSVIAELEGALKSGSSEKRLETLRRVTDLFLGDADRLNETQIKVFDDVLGHLISRIELRALIELSGRLAPVDNAPTDVVRQLARHDDIAVAGPVLAQSQRLTTDDLVEIAQTKGQGHLLSISGRSSLSEPVTDVLLDRGDRNVASALATNAGARFSANGFAALAHHAESDESLTEKLGMRLDLPIKLLRELLLRATEAVRSRLLSHASPDVLARVQSVLTEASTAVTREIIAPRDFASAEASILEMQKRGKLNEAMVVELANSHRYEEVTAALAVLCTAPLDISIALMKSPRSEGLLIACKAAGLKWPTVSAILQNRFAHHSISEKDLAQAKASFLDVSAENAARTLRFWKVRNASQSAAR